MNKRTVVSIVISAAAAVMGVLYKDRIAPTIQGDDLLKLLYYFALIILVALVGIGVERTITFSFERSKRLRKFYYSVFRYPYVEGYWVDVGINQKGGERRIYNYSFIVIEYNDGKYLVDGITWNVDDNRKTTWKNGPEAEFNERERRLTLWYTVTSEASQGVFKADYQFRSSGGWRQDEMTGTYLGDFTTEGERVESRRFLRGGRAKTRNGQTEISFSEAEQNDIAKRYLERVRFRQGMGPGEYKYKDQPRRVGAEYADWYQTFLKQTDEKIDERTFVTEAFLKLPLGNVERILDIGPGDGLLTQLVMQEIVNNARGRELAYIGVEPNPLFHNQVRNRMSRHFAPHKLRLVTQGIDGFAQMEENARFDLIIAFHSLYFADDIRSIVSWLASTRIDHDQILTAFHTDICANPLLKQLIEDGGTKFNTDVIGILAREAPQQGFVAGMPQKRDIPLHFPSLSDGDWEKLRVGSGLGNKPNLVTALELICFLANRDFDSLLAANLWKSVVERIAEYHQRHSHDINQPLSIPVPVQFQHFIRHV